MKDSFGRDINYMRLSVTQLCSLRCRYCMGEDGIVKRSHNDMLTQEQMLLAIRAAASLGVTKLRISGGEPLVKPNIIELCAEASKIDGINELCLTTNALSLKAFAKPLKQAGVKRINISLDTLNEAKYAHITRIGSLSDALEGFHAALDEGFERIKINTVLIGGFNDDEIDALAGITQIYPADVRFIELMPIGPAAEFKKDSFISCDEVLKCLPELKELGGYDGVARLYKLPNSLGTVGLISPLSQHFCSQCNRLRLTADGKLKPCLHSNEEISIKGMDYDGMRQFMIKAIMHKPAMHGELSGQHPSPTNRRMDEIGG